MGPDSGDAHPGLIAQVVPDIPAFALDDGFAYAVPAGMKVEVGSIVRAPLGGRRVRGYVTALRRGDTAGLKPLAGASGELGVFGAGLLQVGRWAALHYVAPLATVLAKSAPPNLPRRPERPRLDAVASRAVTPLAKAIEQATRIRPAHLSGPGPWDDALVELVSAVIGTERSALVLVPSVDEAEAIARVMDRAFLGRVEVAHSGRDAAGLTATWGRTATVPGIVLIGTREAAMWPVAEPGLALIVGEGRRGMKERSTPTLHVREVIRRRAAVERFPLVSVGSVPTLETLASGAELIASPGRSWPLVEIADRTEDPPGSGLISERAGAAIRSVRRSGGSVFVFARSPGYAPAVRCVACRELRRCPACGSAAPAKDQCDRCGAGLDGCRHCGGRRFEALGAGVGRTKELLGRMLAPGEVGDAGSGSPVEVGSERDLLRVGGVSLALVLDGDGLVLAPTYRGPEDALRLLARIAQAVATGRGRRCLIQTAIPEHPVFMALRHGDPVEFLRSEMERRGKEGFPPAGELLIVQAREAPDQADAQLRALAGNMADVLGPVERRAGLRWLVQGRDLHGFKVGLRPVAGRWREGGTRVRIDADPIDL